MARRDSAGHCLPNLLIFVCLITLVDDPQTIQNELTIHHIDEISVICNEPSQATGSNDGGVLTAGHLRLGLADKVLDGTDIPHDGTSLDLRNGILTQDRCRTDQFDAGQHSGLMKQCQPKYSHPDTPRQD